MKNLPYILILFLSSCTINMQPDQHVENDTIQIVNDTLHFKIHCIDSFKIDSIYRELELARMKIDSHKLINSNYAKHLIDTTEYLNAYYDSLKLILKQKEDWLTLNEIRIKGLYENLAFKTNAIKKGWIFEDTVTGFKRGYFMWDSLNRPVTH